MSRFPRYTSVAPIKHCARKLLFSNDRQITNDILNAAGASTTKKHNTTQVRIFNTRTLLLSACFAKHKGCLRLHTQHNNCFRNSYRIKMFVDALIGGKGRRVVDRHPPIAFNPISYASCILTEW